MEGKKETEIGQQPTVFTWGERDHRITEIVQSWQVDIDWWRGRVWRAYYKVTTDSGLLADPLLLELRRDVLVLLLANQRLFGQLVIAGAHGHHRLALPLFGLVELLVVLLLELLVLGLSGI